jgi:hypothetical protein
MLSNAIRGHMAELGIVSAKGCNGTAELFEGERSEILERTLGKDRVSRRSRAGFDRRRLGYSSFCPSENQ